MKSTILGVGCATLVWFGAERVAFADTTTAPAPAASPRGTPLSVRTERPLRLAEQSETSDFGWKAFVMLAVIAGAAWYWRKRGVPLSPTDPALRVLSRASVGARHDVVMIEADGQRILLGVGSGSVSMLAWLGDVGADVSLRRGELAARHERTDNVSRDVGTLRSLFRPVGPQSESTETHAAPSDDEVEALMIDDVVKGDAQASGIARRRAGAR